VTGVQSCALPISGQGVWLDRPQRDALDRLDALFHGPDLCP
jgi:hypothetical protein